MKVNEARQILTPLHGNDLYQKARELYSQEADQLILLRCHSNPTAQAIDGVLSQVSDWLRKVTTELNWGGEDYTEKIIVWERGELFLKHNIMDPKLYELGKRTRLNIVRGTRFPMLEAMQPGDLEAASSFMMAQLRQSAIMASKVIDARKEYATKLGKKECWFLTDARDCPHQETFVMNPEKLPGKIPTNVEQLVFVCNVEKCIRDQASQKETK